MSVESLTVALHHSRAKGTARLVLLGIANHDGDGGSWPSIATLRKYAGGVDRSTVQRALAKLVELGEIEVYLQQGGTQDTPDDLRPNRYRLLLICPGDCDRTSQHRTDRQRRADRGPGRPRGNRAAPTRPGGADAAGGAAPTRPGGAAPTRPEPSSEPNVETGVSQPQPQRAASPVDNHQCDHGWIEDHEGRATRCLVCRPGAR